MMMHCCEIDCDKEAEFEIQGQLDAGVGNTQACTEHVGVLLGTCTWVKDKLNNQWIVTDLKPKSD